MRGKSVSYRPVKSLSSAKRHLPLRFFHLREITLSILAAALLAACGSTTEPHAEPADAVGSATQSSKPEWRHGAMVSAANPYAVDAAAKILSAGGHAVDAAIAAHAVLGLVEPQSSGLGGGAFLLVHDHGEERGLVYDGRETAPAGVTPDLFMEGGEVLGFVDAWQSGKAVGVPGVVAMYKVAHDAHGRLAWEDLFQPAIDLASEGFVVSPRLNSLLSRVARVSLLDDHPASAAYFYPDGEPLPVGFIRKNPEYAGTLQQIAEHGPKAMYEGSLAEAIVAAARMEPRAGMLGLEDLGSYKVIVREPICGEFRMYTICSAPPPSSGLAQIAIAGLYDRLMQQVEDPQPIDRTRAFVDAQRLAYADRDHYVADPAFVSVPTSEMVDPRYLDQRATQRSQPAAPPTHGDPGLVIHDRAVAHHWGADATEEARGTSHLSIVDSEGNAVSMTATVEAPFGSSRFVGGFLLNNEMTDFSRNPRDESGKLVANAPAPGKRPRSSMSPTLVFGPDNELVIATGSPGGNSIPAYVAKSILGVLAWDLSAADAIDFPNIIARGDSVRVEVATEQGKAFASDLTAAGYSVQEREGENSGIHMIVVRTDDLEGAADPRREGEVARLRPVVSD